MTTVTYVTAKQMAARTGMPTALGYTTKSGNILIRRGLDKKTERKVRAHEAEHVARGEEGPFLGLIGAIGGSLISGILGKKSSKAAANAQTQANMAAIEEQRRQFDAIMEMTAPGREVGNQALNVLGSLLIPGFGGIDGMSPVDASGIKLPGADVITADTMRQIRQSGAAGGSTGGNVLTALADRIGAFTSDRLMNPLMNLAGFGPTSTNMAANAASATGANVGSLLQANGVANASGIMGGANSTNAALQNIMQMMMMRGMMGGSSGMPPGTVIGPNGLPTAGW